MVSSAQSVHTSDIYYSLHHIFDLYNGIIFLIPGDPLSWIISNTNGKSLEMYFYSVHKF